MESRSRRLSFLSRHKDLLSPQKQAVARWLLEEWAPFGQSIPRQLRRRVWELFPYDLTDSSAGERVLRDLVLELLSHHKLQIADRTRAKSSGGSRRGRRLTIGWSGRER